MEVSGLESSLSFPHGDSGAQSQGVKVACSHWTHCHPPTQFFFVKMVLQKKKYSSKYFVFIKITSMKFCLILLTIIKLHLQNCTFY